MAFGFLLSFLKIKPFAECHLAFFPPGAAITKRHTRGGLNYRHLLPQLWRPEVWTVVLTGLASLRVVREEYAIGLCL